MPTILINTNLIKSTSAVKTGECCGGNDEEQQRQCIDEEFRQDLNEIIKKLLVKSETMESFTIKYDIDDLKSSSNEAADKTKSEGEKSSNYVVSRKKACICHRMARLFSDLLSNEDEGDEDKTSKKKPSQCGDETDEGAGRHLESIYHEIKLLRKYQVDLDTKFNLLLTKLTYSSNNQQEVGGGGGGGCAGSGNSNVKQNRQLQTRHHPIPNNNRSLQTAANHQSQQHQLNNVNSNLVRMNNSNNGGNKLVNDNHLTLTGAKKRKLNSANSFGQSNMNNNMKSKSRSPSNSSSSTSTTTSRASSAVGEGSNESGNSINKPQQTVELPPAKKQSDGSGKETSFNTSNTSSSTQMKTSPSSSMSSSSAASSSSSSTAPAVAAAAARKRDEIDDVNVKEEEENELDDEEIGVSDQENENDEEDDEDDECLQLATQGFANHDDDDVEFVDNDIIDDYEDQEESNGLNNNNNNEDDDDEDDEANFYGDGSKFQPNFQSLKFNNRVGNKQPLSVAVQNHLKSTTGQSTTPPNVAAAYLNYVYQQQQQQSQHNTKQLNHNHHHNSNHHHQHNRDIFNHSSNLLSQQQPHLSHTNAKNNYFNSASYQLPPPSSHHHHNHHQTSINSLSSMSSGNASLMLKTSPGACSPLGSSLSQQQQQQQALNQSIDIDINELFKGNGPKYLQLESYKNFKPPISKGSDGAYYVEDTMAALSYSKSKSRRNFAAHLTKLVFTPRERLESNCNGRFGKKALDPVRLLAIRNTIFKYYPCKQSTVIVNGDSITSGDSDENSVWVRDCIPAIDESNRVLKKQLVAWYKKNNPDKFPAGYKMECSFSTGGNGANTSSSAAGGAFLEPDLDEFDEQD